MTFDVHQLDSVPAGGRRRHPAGDPRRPGLLARRAAEPADLPAHGRRPRARPGSASSSRTPSSRTRSASLALALILAEGGLTTTLARDPARRCGSGVSLATIGVAVSVGVVAVGCPLPPRAAVGARGAARRGHLADRRGGGVLGAARGAAAPAAHRRARGGVRPQRRAHRRAGDAGLDRRGRGPRAARGRAGSSSTSCVVGVALGLACGLRRRLGDAPGGAARRPASTRSPCSCLTFLAYGAAAAVHGSGFAAVYVAALVLGNSELPHRAATRSFAEGVAWLAQIGLFVMLGLLLSPGRIDLGDRRPGASSPAWSSPSWPDRSRCW